jgi:hypothetical protein
VKVPVFIKYSKIEDICDYDKQEGVICDDYRGYVNVDVGDVQFNRNDLEKIVKEYLDDIADILMMDKPLMEELLKKLDVNINTY